MIERADNRAQIKSEHLKKGSDPLSRLVICFAGDSGDGIQLLGQRFAESRHHEHQDFAAFAEYPAEIRSPPGSLHGVSSYSVQFGEQAITHAGDQADILIAFNPAALKTHGYRLRAGGWLIVDQDAFLKRPLQKAGYQENPLEDNSLKNFEVLSVPISHLTRLALEADSGTHREAMRARNMWVLGMLCQTYGRALHPIEVWIKEKFSFDKNLAERNRLAFQAGIRWSENTETPPRLPQLHHTPTLEEEGKSAVSGSKALALGLYAGARLQRLPMLFASYPITPASPIFHYLARLAQDAHLEVVQAEDEIAACGMAIGASYGGCLGVMGTSGPGFDLITESLGLAVALELPLVIVDVQRAGPSTGMPTKPEQSDLNLAVFGRHGEAPIPVLAATSPRDIFSVACEAVRLAVTAMTPVILLADSTIVNGIQPWRLPQLGEGFYAVGAKRDMQARDKHPFTRQAPFHARPWLVPGASPFRLGGLERDQHSGNISYDADNHARVNALRQMRMDAISRLFPAAEIRKDVSVYPEQCTNTPMTRTALLTWGSVTGPGAMAIERLKRQGVQIDHLVLRHLYPLPRALRQQLECYEKILLPEMNSGHLANIIRMSFGRKVTSLGKIEGRPFTVEELVQALMGLQV